MASSTISSAMQQHLRQPNQAAASSTSSKPIKRKSLLHGCKLCPNVHYYISGKTPGRAGTSSVEGHVEKEHPGMDYLTLTKKWGYRVNYKDGSSETIPIVESDDEEEDEEEAEEDNEASHLQEENSPEYFTSNPSELQAQMAIDPHFTSEEELTDNIMVNNYEQSQPEPTPTIENDQTMPPSSIGLYYHVDGPLVFPQVSFDQLPQLDQAALQGHHGEHIAQLAGLAFFGPDANHPTQPRTREQQMLDMVVFLATQRELFHGQGSV